MTFIEIMIPYKMMVMMMMMMINNSIKSFEALHRERGNNNSMGK